MEIKSRRNFIKTSADNNREIVEPNKLNSNIQSLKCPNCSAPIKLDSNTCDFCGYDYIIPNLSGLIGFKPTTINKYIAFYKNQLNDKPNDPLVNLALGICYLDLGLSEFAQKYIKKAIDITPENSDTYYYYAMSLLKGEKIKLAKISEIKEVEKFLEAAIKLYPSKYVYYYFQIIIKYEFYHRNGFKIEPSIESLREKLDPLVKDENEIKQLIKQLNVDEENARNIIS